MAASPVTREGITVVTVTNKSFCAANLVANYVRQAHASKELVVVVNSSAFGEEAFEEHLHEVPDVRIALSPGTTLGACYNLGISMARHGHVALMEDDDFFCSGYLSQIMDAFSTHGPAVVGKCCRYYYFGALGKLVLLLGEEEQFVPSIAGGLMGLNRDEFLKVGFRDITMGWDTEFMRDCQRQGLLIYATDRRNLMVMRNADKSKHTFQLDDEAWIRVVPSAIVAAMTAEEAREYVAKASC